MACEDCARCEEIEELLKRQIPNLDSCEGSDLDEAEAAFLTLTRYCRRRRAAVNCRLTGHIQDALNHESEMERLYQKLPPAYRW